MANYFPRYTNILPLKIAVCLGALALGVVVAFTYYGSPKAQRVGYMPDQPIPYDHQLHVTQLGLDCRHCHSFVEKSGHANVPTANTCANCHHETKGAIKSDSPRLAPLMEAIDNGKPIEWVRVHKAPDYVITKNDDAKKVLEDYVSEKGLNVDLEEEQGAQIAMGTMLKDRWNVRPKESCFTCHR